ncbi:MFS transporter [Agrococcus sediminis]|uniref:MFS transporter n=1 Tax=Agrococcus sediminis TaxID=2599924 RepID=A0A5M8QJJ7_9MICO|nr:MFS transporter [Agrococcus sediminis]KAA6436245.1 MFS transporter [Agrococcus sediminis]
MSVPHEPPAASAPVSGGAAKGSPDDVVQPSQIGVAPVTRRELGRRATAWALWDWGSASFNAVVTTFVFSRYIASDLFVDPAIVEAAGEGGSPELTRALADNASVVAWAVAIAGLLVALLAPVIGQRSDGGGRRKLWVAVNTGVTILAMVGMFFVTPVPEYLWLGAALLAAGNLFFEFASVNYNAMLHQVSTKAALGRTSGYGWGMGYVGGIVLLGLLLVLFIFPLASPDAGGVLAVPNGREGGALDVRLAVLTSAVWFLVFALPLLLKVPELPPTGAAPPKVGIVESYRILFRTIRRIARTAPKTLLFLAASAVFRDGLSGVFTFGAIIASSVFGFSATEVILFAIAANVTAGAGTFVGGWADDRFGPKIVIVVSLVVLSLSGLAVLFVEGKAMFWVFGLALSTFVGPVQSASRSFMARITPEGREGEMFGLYATTGRAVSFLAPTLFAVFVSLTGDTRFGILGIVLVLLAGLLLVLPVHPRPTVLEGAERGASSKPAA